jgi:hypothetical protein
VSPVTFATGKITLTNGSTSVSGTDTVLNLDFKAGQYLFYYNNSGDPILAGKIAGISSPTTMTLESAFPGSTQTLVNCGMTNMVIGGGEQFIMQIPTIINSATSTCILPNWVNYVTSFAPKVIGENNSSYSKLEQYSNVNSPQTAATPPLTNVPYIITPLSNFQSYKAANGTRLYFQTINDFPRFCYARINPYGDNESLLPANTLFRFFVNESFPLNGINVGLGTDYEALYKSGYIL